MARAMRQQIKILEAQTRSGFLQNYFALTLVVGIGVLIILISFTVSVHHQYQSEFQTFEVYRLDRHREIVNYLMSAERQFELSYDALAEVNFKDTDFLAKRLEGSPYSCIMVARVDPTTLVLERLLTIKSTGKSLGCRNYNSSLLNDAVKDQNAERTYSKASFAVPEGTIITLAKKLPRDDQYLLASVPVRDLIAQYAGSPIQADIMAVSRVTALDPRYGRPDDTNMYMYASEKFFNEVIHIRYLLRGKEAAIEMGWAWIILLLGAVILSLVAYIIYNLIRQNLKIREEVSRTTQSLRDATQKAIEANETKSRFLASISHEIRTPLNLIMGMSEMLSDTPVNPEQKEYIATFNKASEHLLELMNDILDMAMVERGEIILRESRIEIANLIEGVSDLIAPACQKKKILYNHIITPEVPAYVFTGEKRLKQILINLLNNALKYTDRGEIQLYVHLQKDVMPDLERIVFDVMDTGRGIPSEQLERIFDAFYQVESVATEKEGVGLGLALVRSYSRLLGGSVSVDSKEGRGSTFSVSLSLKTDNMNSWLSDCKLPQEAIREGGPSILLYSKNPIQTSYIGKSLDWMGYKVMDVDSYHQVILELGASGKVYDKVILDLSVGSADNSDQDLTEACKSMDLRREDLVLILPIGQNQSDKLKMSPLDMGEILFAPIKIKALAQALSRPKTGALKDGDSTRPATDESQPLSYQTGEGACLLVVEDDIDSQFLFRSYLADQKLNIVYMVDSAEAFDYFKNHSSQVTAILTDMQMPGMDGCTLIRNIREFESEHKLPSTPIAILTGESADVLSHDDFMMGTIESYLVKPIRKKQLIEVIQSLLKNKTAPELPGAV